MSAYRTAPEDALDVAMAAARDELSKEAAGRSRLSLQASLASALPLIAMTLVTALGVWGVLPSKQLTVREITIAPAQAQITLGAGGINLRSAEGGPRLSLLVDEALVSLELSGNTAAHSARYDTIRKGDPLRFVSQEGHRFDVAASGVSLQLAGSGKERTRLTTEFLRLEHDGFALLRNAHVLDLFLGAPTLATRDPAASVHLDAEGLRLSHLSSPHFITFTATQLRVAGESMSELGLEELAVDNRGHAALAKYKLPPSLVPIRW